MYMLSDTASGSSASPLTRKSHLVWKEKDSTCQGPLDGMSGQWSHDQLPKMVKNQSCSSALYLPELCPRVLLLWRYELKDSSHCWLFFCFFVFFCIFFHEKTPNNTISTHLDSWKKALQLLYHGKFDPKRKCIPQKGNWHYHTTKHCW